MTNKLPEVGKRYIKKLGHDIGEEYVLLGETATGLLKFKDTYGKYSETDYYDIHPDLLPRYFEELPEDKAETECSVGKKSNCKKCGREFLQHHKSDYYCSNYCRYMSETETKPETQSHISELSPEVKKAMDDLKYHAGIVHYFDKESALDDIKDAAKILLNALDKQFSQTSKSVDVKEEEVKENERIKKHGCCDAILEKDWRNHKCKIEEESIWKPVSELPEFIYTPFVFMRFDSGVIGFGRIDKIKGKTEFVDINREHCYPKEIIQSYAILTDFINDYEKLKERVRKLESLREI